MATRRSTSREARSAADTDPPIHWGRRSAKARVRGNARRRARAMKIQTATTASIHQASVGGLELQNLSRARISSPADPAATGLTTPSARVWARMRSWLGKGWNSSSTEERSMECRKA